MSSNTIPTRSGSFLSLRDSIQLAENKRILTAHLPLVNGYCETVPQLIVESYPQQLLHPLSLANLLRLLYLPLKFNSIRQL